jgi:hypothetical protein
MAVAIPAESVTLSLMTEHCYTECHYYLDVTNKSYILSVMVPLFWLQRSVLTSMI